MNTGKHFKQRKHENMIKHDKFRNLGFENIFIGFGNCMACKRY